MEQILLAVAAIGVLGGWLAGRVAAWIGQRRSDRVGKAAHHARSLEAELRVAQRKAEEAELALELHREEYEALRQRMAEQAAEHDAREGQLARLQKELAEECAKTQALRAELLARVEESVRASVRAKDAETELSVARAGADAVVEQVHRLAAERERLSQQLESLEMRLSGRHPKVTPLPARDPGNR